MPQHSTQCEVKPLVFGRGFAPAPSTIASTRYTYHQIDLESSNPEEGRRTCSTGRCRRGRPSTWLTTWRRATSSGEFVDQDACNAPDVHGDRPLTVAVLAGKIRALCLLLERGAWPSAPSCSPYGNGATPLHYACAKADADCVHILLRGGADPNATTTSGGRSPSPLLCRAPLPVAKDESDDEADDKEPPGANLTHILEPPHRLRRPSRRPRGPNLESRGPAAAARRRGRRHEEEGQEGQEGAGQEGQRQEGRQEGWGEARPPPPPEPMGALQQGGPSGFPSETHAALGRRSSTRRGGPPRHRQGASEKGALAWRHNAETAELVIEGRRCRSVGGLCLPKSHLLDSRSRRCARRCTCTCQLHTSPPCGAAEHSEGRHTDPRSSEQPCARRCCSRPWPRRPRSTSSSGPTSSTGRRRFPPRR